MPEINLHGKNAIILSVADEKSLAFAIANKLSLAGANLAIGYQPRNQEKVNQIKNKL